jgi:hypothetical protein
MHHISLLDNPDEPIDTISQTMWIFCMVLELPLHILELEDVISIAETSCTI